MTETNEQEEIEKKLKTFDNLNQSKWMRYEGDIIKYYYNGLREWLDGGMIKPSITAFTSGLGRDIARLMEEAKKQGKTETETEKNNKINDILKELKPLLHKGGRSQIHEYEIRDIVNKYWEEEKEE